MSTLHAEYWDSVVAPAIPAGWQADSVFSTTSTFQSGVSAISTPNALVLTPADGSDHFATWGTEDSNGGNVVVSTYLNVENIPSHSRAGVTARGSSSTIGGSSTYYRAYVDYVKQWVNVDAVVSGSPTTIFTVGISGGGPNAVDWYWISLSLNGTSVTVQLWDYTGNRWLNSSGNWQSSQTAAITGNDGTISGAGYAGLYGLQSPLGGYDWYADNWLLATSQVIIPPGRGVLLPYQQRPVSGPAFSSRYG